MDCTAPKAQPNHFDFWENADSAHLAHQHQRPNATVHHHHHRPPSEIEASASAEGLKPPTYSRRYMTHLKNQPQTPTKDKASLLTGNYRDPLTQLVTKIIWPGKMPCDLRSPGGRNLNPLKSNEVRWSCSFFISISHISAWD